MPTEQDKAPSLSAPTFKRNVAPSAQPKRDPSDNPAAVGLLDIIDSGWFNSDSGEICRGVPIASTDLVVDVGCGDGGAIKFCANQGADIIFLDINEEKVKHLEAQLQGLARGRVRGIAGTGEQIDIANDTADKVICTEVLEHVDDPAALMSEMVRIGKPGALYLLTVPHELGEMMMKDTAPPQYFEKPNHIRIFSESDFRNLVEGAGLTIERYEAFGAFWTIFFTIFWPTGSDFNKPHPALVNWSKTWNSILELEKGPLIKAALEQAIPNKQFILARKREEV
jgi:2-polyprenyl-3-methyl-5-hydroxy-6-metoxy-1,4-benzoquinol methylase